MKPEFKVGLSAELAETSTDAQGVRHLGEGVPAFYSTPAMIALMERTSIELLKPYLEEGEGSVGVKVNIKHFASTEIGAKVRAKSTLQAINNRRCVFAVEAFNEKGKIGEGTHERTIITVKKFAGQP